MFFFFRRPTVELIVYTKDKYVYDYNKIDLASKFIPTWYKETPTSCKPDFWEINTIKKCPAIIKNLTSGFIMPLWSDLAIDINERKVRCHFADLDSTVSAHEPAQWQNYKDPSNHVHLKIADKWKARTKEDIYFLWQEPPYNPSSEHMQIVQGVDNYKYTHSTSINYFLNTEKNINFVIKQGTPLVHLLPITERKVKLRHELVSEKEYENIGVKQFVFKDYQKSIKCPFHKGE